MEGKAQSRIPYYNTDNLIFSVFSSVVNAYSAAQCPTMAGDMKSALAVRLKDARRKAKLSQEELAEKVGRSVDGISNIERGINLPSLDTLIDICGALSISAAVLVEELQSPAKPSERQELEWRLRSLCHNLPERDLSLAIDLIAAVRRQGS